MIKIKEFDIRFSRNSDGEEENKSDGPLDINAVDIEPYVARNIIFKKSAAINQFRTSYSSTESWLYFNFSHYPKMEYLKS